MVKGLFVRDGANRKGAVTRDSRCIHLTRWQDGIDVVTIIRRALTMHEFEKGASSRLHECRLYSSLVESGHEDGAEKPTRAETDAINVCDIIIGSLGDPVCFGT
jgi:hypothetical protein